MATADAADSERPPIDDAREELQAGVPEATATMRELLDAEDDRIQLQAAGAILDRAGLSKAKATSIGSVQKEVGGESSTYGPGSTAPLENLF